MRDRSTKLRVEDSGLCAGGEYAPVRLPPDFPISKPHLVTRSAANAIKAHIHECLEIGYCHDGSGIFLIGDKMLHCGPGDAVAIRQGEMHLLVSPQDSSTRWSFVNLDPVALLAGALRELGEADSAHLSSNVIARQAHPDVCTLVKDIVDELDGDLPDRRQAVQGMVWTLMVKLRRLAKNEGSRPPDAKSFDELDRLRPAVRQIADNFAKDISVAELAKLCHMSDANFRRLFHRRLGLAPRDYVLRLRIEVAKSLLRNSTLPVLELSLKAGFPSLSNFNRQFKRFVKNSPRDFRRSSSDFESARP